MTTLTLDAPTILFFSFSLLVLLWGRYYETAAYQLNTYRIRAKKNLPRNLKILHLTDIHFRKETKSLTRFFDQISAEVYDFIFLTGDIIDHIESLPYAVSCFKKLKSRLGFFCVLGNHDYVHYHFIDLFEYYFKKKRRPSGYTRANTIKKALASAGIRVLHNETVTLEDGDFNITIHGLDDPVTGQAVPDALELGGHQGSLEILLTHSIDAVKYLDMKLIDLSFSGHSHGGQVRLPGFGAIITHTRMGKDYADGVVEYENHTQCVIGRGLGSNRFIPFRFLCLPEVLVLDIHGISGQDQKSAGVKKILQKAGG